MIKKLILKDFRNYPELDIEFTSPLNVFTGENGQGKTSLLEAVFFISLLRSFKTSQIRDMKRIGSGGFYIGTEIEKGDNWTKFLEVEYLNSRKLKVDGSPVNKGSEFIRQIKTVAFSPDDINIVTGNSGLRRRFMDIFISMLEPSYLAALHSYSTALKSRNTVLRTPNSDKGILEAYEPIMADNGSYIVQLRKKYASMLSNEVNSMLSQFHDRDVKFEIRYRFTAENENSSTYLDKFNMDRDRDIRKGYTTFGPQLDDFDLIYNGKLLKTFGSTGQCRLISLCLKMAKVNIFSGTDSKSVVVLVDDVTGELDLNTRETFFRVINKAGQAFFTFTEPPMDDYFENADFFYIENGTCSN